MKLFKTIGLMSGTSLDGVDIIYCIFKSINNKWLFEIKEATTYEYSDEWRQRLKTLDKKDAITFIKTHIDYGHFLGNLVQNFIKKNNLTPDLISSHGHTIFHQPEKRITTQIGDGSAIAAITGLTVICDFRSMDVALGGQGAPLVAIGDKHLFPDFHYCLNLGGFANISYEENCKTIAFDICPVNIILNLLAGKLGLKFDNNGKIARTGKINKKLSDDLNNIDFYKNKSPKSLSKEWVINNILPIINNYNIPVKDKLRTFCEHIAIQISNAATCTSHRKILVTGGGANNSFLIERLKANTNHKIIIPDTKIINFKEALVFAFLGILRITKKINCLRTVTGAIRDNIGGAVYYG